MNSNNLVTQSNELIEARQIDPLSVREQKIVLTIVSMVQPDDVDFRVYEMYVKDFHEMLGLSGREHYTQMKDVVKGLMYKIVEIPKKDGGWVLTHWTSHVEYKMGEGKIEFSFDPKLKPYLLQLKQAFTSYRLSNILSLKSAYSIRLYELMKKWQHLGKWEIQVKDLKEKLGISKDKYKQYGHLKSRAIQPSIREVNEKTDIEVSFREIRKGRKVVKIEFIIKCYKEKKIVPNGAKKKQSDEKLFNRLNEYANGYNLSLTVFGQIKGIAKNIYSKDEYIEQLEKLIEVVNLKIRQGKVNNPIGLLIKIIKDKEELFGNGLNPKFEDVSSEVVPDWFKNQNKKKEDKPETPEEIQKRNREQEDISNLLKEYIARN